MMKKRHRNTKTCLLPMENQNNVKAYCEFCGLVILITQIFYRKEIEHGKWLYYHKICWETYLNKRLHEITEQERYGRV